MACGREPVTDSMRPGAPLATLEMPRALATPDPLVDAALAGLVAVVTGASSGVGRAIALALAARRAVICAVGRDSGRLARVARDARSTARDVLVHQADLGSEDEVGRLARRIRNELGRLDVLVHSAGILRVGSHAETPAHELDLQYRVNVRAPYHLTQALLPLLRASHGQVVFINSSAGLRAGRTNGAYASTKHALRALADSLRDEVNADGVRVLSVYPGRMATPMQQALFAREGRAYDPARLLAPEDVAAMVVAVLSLPHRAEVTDISIRPTRTPS
jgi:NAD(P)-dependent dehydrogenase (short-subunit alcohol dehydrogenase family)